MWSSFRHFHDISVLTQNVCHQESQDIEVCVDVFLYVGQLNQKHFSILCLMFCHNEKGLSGFSVLHML